MPASVMSSDPSPSPVAIDGEIETLGKSALGGDGGIPASETSSDPRPRSMPTEGKAGFVGRCGRSALGRLGGMPAIVTEIEPRPQLTVSRYDGSVFISKMTGDSSAISNSTGRSVAIAKLGPSVFETGSRACVEAFAREPSVSPTPRASADRESATATRSSVSMMLAARASTTNVADATAPPIVSHADVAIAARRAAAADPAARSDAPDPRVALEEADELELAPSTEERAVIEGWTARAHAAAASFAQVPRALRVEPAVVMPAVSAAMVARADREGLALEPSTASSEEAADAARPIAPAPAALASALAVDAIEREDADAPLACPSRVTRPLVDRPLDAIASSIVSRPASPPAPIPSLATTTPSASSAPNPKTVIVLGAAPDVVGSRRRTSVALAEAG
jgi:hypothetical protein